VLRRLEADSGECHVPPYAIALMHAGLGERERALEWLDKAYAERARSKMISRRPR
jgi:hypothetical protein